MYTNLKYINYVQLILSNNAAIEEKFNQVSVVSKTYYFNLCVKL